MQLGQNVGKGFQLISSWYIYHSCNSQLRSFVADEDLRGRNVLHFNLFPLLRDCSTVAQPHHRFVRVRM